MSASIRQSMSAPGLRPALSERRRASLGGLVVHRSSSQEKLAEGFRPLSEEEVAAADAASASAGRESPSGSSSKPSTPGGCGGGGQQRRRRSVMFDVTPKRGRNVIPITPYALIYGRHPDHFNFDRSGKMKLTPEGVEAEEQGVQPWTPTKPTTGLACVSVLPAREVAAAASV